MKLDGIKKNRTSEDCKVLLDLLLDSEVYELSNNGSYNNVFYLRKNYYNIGIIQNNLLWLNIKEIDTELLIIINHLLKPFNINIYHVFSLGRMIINVDYTVLNKLGNI